MNPAHDFTGRAVVVTGATSGVGQMIAQAFVADGAQVFICGRDAARSEAAAARMADGAAGSCTGFGVDLSSLDGVKALAAAVSGRTDCLHTLVNNAGALCDAPIDDYPEDGWDSVLDLNLKATFFLVQQFLPLLRAGSNEAHPASVINIGSVGGLRVGPRETYAYAAAKAGTHHLTHSLARRLGPENITVNAIAPGFFPSEMTKITSDAMMAQITQQIPRRRVGRPDDIAGLARFLASPAAGFLSGAVIPLDGAMSV